MLNASDSYNIEQHTNDPFSYTTQLNVIRMRNQQNDEEKEENQLQMFINKRKDN